MAAVPRYLDAYLQAIRPPALLALARAWDIAPAASPQAALASILAVLNDPSRLQRLVAALSAQEQTALALVLRMGGSVDAEALTSALRVLGFPCPSANGSMIGDPLIDMAQRGLLLHDSLYDPLTLSTYYGPCHLIADARLLAHAGQLTVVPLDIDPCPAPPSSVARAPANLTLDILTIVRTIEQSDGLKLTNAGALRVADLRRLSRALGWPETGPEIAGTPFPQAIPTLIMVLWSAGLLTTAAGVYVASPTVSAFVQQGYAEQVRTLLQSSLQSQRWQEWPDPPWREADAQRQQQWRLILLSALLALPTNSAFVAIDDLVAALFARIGHSFSLGGPVNQPLYRYRESLPRGQSAEEAWHTQLWATWQQRERAWISRALSTWLAYLGLVEIGLVDGAPAAVRLTELGQAVLRPDQFVSATTAFPPERIAWVVQPNFEILVYVDHVAAELLPLLDDYAERVQVEPHTARYRLTHEAVYAGLERGGTLQTLLDALARGAGGALPQNVRATLTEWARQREQMTVYRQARLLEYRDAAARQKALDVGQVGTPIGERFILASATADMRSKQRIDYAKPRPACLTATEQGVIQLARPADLFVRATLDAWAERQADGGWQLTPVSVQTMVDAGLPLSPFLAELRAALTQPLPPLLEVALHAWAGERPTSALGSGQVFRCLEPAVVRAIAESALFRPYIRAVLGPTALLIDDWQIAAFRERLAWAGLDVVGLWDGEEAAERSLSR
jgi:hypothetical protein